MGVVEILKGTCAGHRCSLNGDQFLIGRAEFCELQLEENSVSRQHARIVRSQDGYYLEDLDSLNGTFVNGRRISRCKLRDRDRIHVYEVLLIFHESLGEVEEADEVPLATELASPADSTAQQRVGPQLKLHALLEMTRSLASVVELDELLSRILDNLFDILPQAEQGWILLPDGPRGRLAPHAFKHRSGETEVRFDSVSRAAATEVMATGKPILAADQIPNQSGLRGARKVMSVPLVGPSRQPQGVIHLEARDPDRPFEETDLELLLGAAAIGGQAVEYVQAHAASKLYSRRQWQLGMARNVQLHMLPHAPPEVPGYEFFQHYQAADVVGGDYFGYVPLAHDKIAIAAGDVVGKGLGAALLMAQLGAEVRRCLNETSDPAEALCLLNRALSEPLGSGELTTFVLGVLDPSTHQLAVANAGHLPPLRRNTSGIVEELGAACAGLPLGVDADGVYTQEVVTLGLGDTVVIYTDGISEALTRGNQMYGADRAMRAVICGPPGADPLGRYLLEDVQRFVGGHPQADDICIVCFARTTTD